VPSELFQAVEKRGHARFVVASVGDDDDARGRPGAVRSQRSRGAVARTALRASGSTNGFEKNCRGFNFTARLGEMSHFFLLIFPINRRV
jgi:hypothetical protein